MNDLTRQMFTDWITSQVDDDPELIAKVVPDYPATGKRTLQDNGSWLRTLTRDNVELVRTGIDHIEPDAVVTDRRRRATRPTCIVYATGFLATRVLFPMEIIGRDGVDLRDAVGRAAGRVPRHHRSRLPEPLLHVRAGHEPRARRQPDLPLRVPDALHHAVPRPADRRRTTARWSRARTGTTTGTSAPRREIKTLVWSQPSVKHSFFKNADGEIHGLSPWRLVDYWTWTKQPDFDDFVLK